MEEKVLVLELGEMKVEGDEGEGVTKPAIYNRPTQPPPPLSQPRAVHHDLQIHSRIRADLPRDVRQANARPSREHPVEHAAHQVAPAHLSMAQRDFVPRQLWTRAAARTRSTFAKRAKKAKKATSAPR